MLGELHELDEVAYLRFASVYKEFQGAEDFDARLLPSNSRGRRPASRLDYGIAAMASSVSSARLTILGSSFCPHRCESGNQGGLDPISGFLQLGDEGCGTCRVALA